MPPVFCQEVICGREADGVEFQVAMMYEHSRFGVSRMCFEALCSFFRGSTSKRFRALATWGFKDALGKVVELSQEHYLLQCLHTLPLVRALAKMQPIC